jgi:hypothetical protein
LHELIDGEPHGMKYITIAGSIIIQQLSTSTMSSTFRRWLQALSMPTSRRGFARLSACTAVLFAQGLWLYAAAISRIPSPFQLPASVFVSSERLLVRPSAESSLATA